MRHAVWIFLVVFFGITQGVGLSAEAASPAAAEPEDYRLLKAIISAEFNGQVPHDWGETVPGVQTRLRTEDKVLAIGVDACDLMAKGDDAKLIKFLEAEKIPATIFVCGTWIEKYPAVLKDLAANALFEIANRGISRKACSVNGKAAGETPGTASVEELFNEIERNARKIEAVTGTLPHYYRAGAGYYDDVAVRIVKALGYEAVGASILPAGGAEAGKEQILAAFTNPASGAIAIFGGISLQSTFVEGVMESLLSLRSRGYKLVKVSDYPPE